MKRGAFLLLLLVGVAAGSLSTVAGAGWNGMILSPPNQSIQAGGTARYTITAIWSGCVGECNAFYLSVSVTNAPSSVSFTLNSPAGSSSGLGPNSCPWPIGWSGTCTIYLIVSSSSNTPTGNYWVIVTGISSSGSAISVTANVAVQGNSLTPTSVSGVPSGQSGVAGIPVLLQSDSCGQVIRFVCRRCW